MKIIKIIGTSATLALLMLTASVSSDAQTAELVIQTTAQCQECKDIIERALIGEKGVRFAELDMISKKVRIVYNSKRTNPELLRGVISHAGYDADDIPADPEAVKKLDPCCTKDGHRN